MMIKKTAKIVTLLLAAALCLCSCGKSLKDIKITSYEVTSVAPRGLSAFDATIDLGVNNPSVQFSLSAISATVKMDGAPCLYLTADDVKVEARSEQVYTLILHGVLDKAFNPFSLLTLLQNPDLEPITLDLSYHGSLKGGLGKDFDYKDIKVKDLIGRL